jgi:DNA-binding NarL/FixJ family response regulator
MPGGSKKMDKAVVAQEKALSRFARMYSADSPADPSPGAEAITVLIADDDTGFRKTLRKVMETKRGFEVSEARDGEEAVQLTRLVHPDLVLMDLSMPRIDGLEAMRMIRAELPGVCIIACSVHDETVYRRAATLHGANAFVTKSRCYAELDWVESVTKEARSCTRKTNEC